MKNLKFKYLMAKNFLCFGPKGIELYFKNCGDIVLISGENLDVVSEDGSVASNGTGKSSIPEAIIYGLYGKTIKNLRHEKIINNQIGKKLYIEIIWDDYRIVRTREPNSLKLWQSKDGIWDDDTEISKGKGIPSTQKEIESIIGLNYDTFVNVVVFSDDNRLCFLELDTPTKRKLIENLLSLEKYCVYTDNAKKLLKDNKDKIKFTIKECENYNNDLDNYKLRIIKIKKEENDWKNTQIIELKKLTQQIKDKKQQLSQSDIGDKLVKFKEAKNKIDELNQLLPNMEEKEKEIDDTVQKCRTKLNLIKENRHKISLDVHTNENNIKTIKSEIKKQETTIDNLKIKKDTANCPWCYGKVDEINFQHVITHSKNEIDILENKLKDENSQKKLQDDKLKKYDETINTIENLLNDANSKKQYQVQQVSLVRKELNDLSKIKEPKAGSDELIIQQQIEDLTKLALKKKDEVDGQSPFGQIILQSEDDVKTKEKQLEDKKKEVRSLEENNPYLEFWTTAFGDNGIRKFIIDGIIPALNSRISYWLQYLIDNKIKLEFDNTLQETIERNPSIGDPFVYDGMSGGEKRRLNLAVSQAFAHIRILNSGTQPSLVFLDEVSSNIDSIGIQGVYKMICQLSKDKQVFVTTHDKELLGLLEGCKKIQLRRDKGFTEIIN